MASVRVPQNKSYYELYSFESRGTLQLAITSHSRATRLLNHIARDGGIESLQHSGHFAPIKSKIDREFIEKSSYESFLGGRFCAIFGYFPKSLFSPPGRNPLRLSGHAF